MSDIFGCIHHKTKSRKTALLEQERKAEKQPITEAAQMNPRRKVLSLVFKGGELLYTIEYQLLNGKQTVDAWVFARTVETIVDEASTKIMPTLKKLKLVKDAKVTKQIVFNDGDPLLHIDFKVTPLEPAMSNANSAASAVSAELKKSFGFEGSRTFL